MRDSFVETVRAKLISLEPSMRWRLRDMLRDDAHQHETWVENRGLHNGNPGPLDDLINELEACAEAARQLKKEAEEGDD